MLDAVEHSSEAELWGIRNLGSFKQGPGSDFFGGYSDQEAMDETG